MLRFMKKDKSGTQFMYEEKPENSNIELTGENIKKLLSLSDDIIVRELYINANKDLPVTFCYVDGLIDSKAASDDIMKPLLQEAALNKVQKSTDIINLIEHGVLYYISAVTRDHIDDTISDILNGSAALIFSDEKLAITFDIKGFDKRSIQEPTDENVIKGAKDSFIEVIRVNTALLRRRIRTQNLRIKQIIVGKQTLTPVAVCYIEGIANDKMVEEVIKRLQKIDNEGVIATSSIEENIVDSKFTAFPQIIYTERPDRLASYLVEGKVGIFIDGLPMVYIVPGAIKQYLKAPEDYSRNFLVASMISIIRYLSLVVTLFLPGFYISLSTFHQEMIPTELAITIISSKEGVPFPVFIEVTIMLIAFEVLLEAGLRLPKPIGQAVSIVGGLVVGQAAVQAKLASPAVVIVVAVSAIAGFTMPNQDFANAIRLWRFIMTFLASLAGLFTLSLGLIILIMHWSTIETFGVAYLTPFSANEGQEIAKETILRLPVWMMKKRPRSLKTVNKIRQK